MNPLLTPAGLTHPNHYLPVAIRYLLTHRPKWRTDRAVGKTLVTTGMIDRVVRKLGRRLCEVPAAYHWFAPGLLDGALCFGGEASAGPFPPPSRSTQRPWPPTGNGVKAPTACPR